MDEGVKVNIRPLHEAGLLAVREVIKKCSHSRGRFVGGRVCGSATTYSRGQFEGWYVMSVAQSCGPDGATLDLRVGRGREATGQQVRLAPAPRDKSRSRGRSSCGHETIPFDLVVVAAIRSVHLGAPPRPVRATPAQLALSQLESASHLRGQRPHFFSGQPHRCWAHLSRR